MQLAINGEFVEVPDSCRTIRELLAHLRLDGKIVVVEHNGRILNKNEHDAADLADQDRIEMVHFVGGG